MQFQFGMEVYIFTYTRKPLFVLMFRYDKIHVAFFIGDSDNAFKTRIRSIILLK